MRLCAEGGLIDEAGRFMLECIGLYWNMECGCTLFPSIKHSAKVS